MSHPDYNRPEGSPSRLAVIVVAIIAALAILTVIVPLAVHRGLLGGQLTATTTYAAENESDDVPMVSEEFSLEYFEGNRCIGVRQVAGSMQPFVAGDKEFPIVEFAANIDSTTHVVVDINHGGCSPIAYIDAFMDNTTFNRYQAACLGPLKQCYVRNLVVDEKGNVTDKPGIPSGNLMPPPTLVVPTKPAPPTLIVPTKTAPLLKP